MNDLIVAVGLVLVIEGLLWAVSPQFAIRMLAVAAETPLQVLRFAGTIAVAIGVLIVWVARG